MTSESPITRQRVVVVGGGIAALETVLALHDLAEAQLDVTLVAPEERFVMRPLATARPFARGHADTLSLADFMRDHGGRFVRDAITRVDADRKVVQRSDGSVLAYDALVLVPGASSEHAFRHVLTFGLTADPDALNGILRDMEAGYTHNLAFVVPRGCTWPLPLYELALMTADQVWSMGISDAELHFVTPELRPLGIFGTDASAVVAETLKAARITLHTGVLAEIEPGMIDMGFGPPLEVERIVALPTLEGPRLSGVPCNSKGFIPVDAYGRVEGLEDVYAAGDATDQPIKQGGLACQQAVVAARQIAAAAGADVEVAPFEAVLRGRLLTGRRDHFLRRELDQHTGEATPEPLWWPPAKVSSHYLAPFLAAQGLISLPLRGATGLGLDVRVPLTWQQRWGKDVLGLEPLGPIRA
jgi:sulfide:quinone oxidoreductase